MTTVVLHLGAMKTGTSFLQRVMTANRDRLAAQGVLWPGERWGVQVGGVKEALTGQHPAPMWEALLEEIRAWDGSTAIISMEFMAGASPERAARLASTLSPHRLRAVLGARDLARTIPAQWQESVQSGSAWTFAEYLEGVQGRRRRGSDTGRHFWRRQDWGRTLRNWAPVVPEGDLLLMTVPSPGSPPTALLERFASACGFDAEGFDLDVAPNAAVGATSAELMRRLNERALGRRATDEALKVLTTRVAKATLGARAATEPTVSLPPTMLSWVRATTEELLSAIAAIDPVLVGSLDDLRVQEAAMPAEGRWCDPAATADGELLDAALDALLGMAMAAAVRRS